MTVYLKDTTVLTSDEERAFVASAINKFSTGGHPVADAASIGNFSVECAIDCLETAMLKGQAGGKHTVRLVSALLHRMYETQGDEAAFTCEECALLKPLPADGNGPCDECRVTKAEDDEADFFNETVTAASDAFWATVAKRYREKGVTSGDFPPDAHLAFMTACTEAVTTWLSWNKPRRSQKSDSAAEEIADRGDDGIDFRDKWDPDRDFHAAVSAAFAGAHGMPGWTVTYDYPGYFCFRHKDRPNFQILATPDHEDDGTIAVDAMDDHGKNLRTWTDIAWPLKERLFHPNGECVPKLRRASWLAERFIAKLGPILAECEPRKLVVEYDVTGMPPKDVEAFRAHLWDAAVECEMSGDVLTNDIVPLEDK